MTKLGAPVCDNAMGPRCGLMLRAAVMGLGIAVFAPAAASAQSLDDLAPSFASCGETHGDPDTYIAELVADGWTVTADRDAAIARLSDAFLPLHGPGADGWDAMLAYRAEVGAIETEEIAATRDIYEQDGSYLVIGGYTNDLGEFRVDCWLAFPDTVLMSVLFSRTEDLDDSREVRLTALPGPSHEDGSVTRMMAVQLIPAEQPDPPLAGQAGLYIQTIVPPAPVAE